LFGYLPRMNSTRRKGSKGSLAVVAAAIAVATLVPVGLTGCASPARTTGAEDPIGRVPADLWVEVDVSPGRTVSDRAKVEERRARFVLLPDGSLHGETDRVPEDRLRPARVRKLSREQMADLWGILASSGFTDPTLADTRTNVKLLEPTAGEILATLEVHADGERFAFVRRYTPGGEDQPALRRAIRAIASLGWASDEALAETAELPLRYDLGADPYARFAPASEPAKEPSK
jgi:hypothetical protein